MKTNITIIKEKIEQINIDLKELEQELEKVEEVEVNKNMQKYNNKLEWAKVIMCFSVVAIILICSVVK